MGPGLVGLLVLPLAIMLSVLAIDALRAPGQLASDDARFQTAPMRQAGLWDVALSESLLGLEDDMRYRELAGEYLKVEPGKVDYQGFPERELLRAKVHFDLTRMSREDSDPVRRSRLLTMYGVMALDARRPLRDVERKQLFLDAVSAFRNAIVLDPANIVAKTNLELAIRLESAALGGDDPSRGPKPADVPDTASARGGGGSGY